MGRAKLTPREESLKPIIAGNIKKYLDEFNKKPADLQRGTGIAQSTISDYTSGKTLVNPGNVEKIASFFGVLKSDIDPRFSDEWVNENEFPLIEQTVETMKKLSEERQENVLKFSKMQLDEQKARERRRIKIEVIKPKEENKPLELHPVKVKEHISLAAGLGFSYDETGEYATYYTDRTDLKCFDEGFLVDGDSMEPEIHDNDIALVKYNYHKVDGCIYAFDYDGKSYIKYLYFYDDRIVVKSANNEKYPDWEISFEELAYDGYTHFKIVGEVVDWFTPEVV